MKRVYILLCLFQLAKDMAAQDTMGDCVKNIFVHADSVSDSGKNPFEEWKVCVIGKPMPNFLAKGITGDSVEMRKLQGKIVVINFWFIDCLPCIAEIPGLNKLVGEYYGKNVEFLALTWETQKRIYEDFFSKYKLDFTIVPMSRVEIDKLIASGYPTTFIIDELGIIRTAWNGGRTDEKAGIEFYEKAKSVIDALIKS